MVDALIIGGGPAGLSAAFYLKRAGVSVALFEADKAVGGNVQTLCDAGYRYEKGPHTFLGSASEIFSLADALGISDKLLATEPSANKRFIVRQGHAHEAPAGPWSFLTTRLLSSRAKLELLAEPWRSCAGNDQDTAAEFFERRFGREAATVLAGAFIGGVYAGDPRALSAAAAFPLFWRFEREHRSMVRGAIKERRRKARSGEPGRKGLFSFQGGLGSLSAALFSALGTDCQVNEEMRRIEVRGDRFVCHTSAGAFEAGAVIVATPPAQAASLLSGLSPQLSHLLSSVPMARVASVHLGFAQRQENLPDAFGALAPRGEELRSLGVLFPSRLFSDRTPQGGDLLTGFVGGVLDEPALQLGDQELAKLVAGDVAKLFGPIAGPEFVHVHRHTAAIPQLVVGHLEKLQQARTLLASFPGLWLAGNYLTGVGLKDAVRSGQEAAAAALEHVGHSHGGQRRAS